jgi:hypothetical protein
MAGKMGSKDKMPTAGIARGKPGKSAPVGSKQGVGARGKAAGAPHAGPGARPGTGPGSVFGKC